jgi:hypothetical protein
MGEECHCPTLGLRLKSSINPATASRNACVFGVEREVLDAQSRLDA